MEWRHRKSGRQNPKEVQMTTSTITKSRRDQETEVQHPFNDLCTTCINAENCKGASNRKSSMFFCEEFEVETLQGIRFNNEPHTPAPLPPVEPGICVNCALRFNCNVKKPESGIWHCEMYE